MHYKDDHVPSREDAGREAPTPLVQRVGGERDEVPYLFLGGKERGKEWVGIGPWAFVCFVDVSVDLCVCVCVYNVCVSPSFWTK